MDAGNLLVVHCWYGLIPYSHYAIDMGDGTVIQLACDPVTPHRGIPDRKSMRVRQTTFAEFAVGRPVQVVEVRNALATEEVLQRAKSKLGLSAYCLVNGNCEHFARWCKTGVWVSQQVQETRQSFARTALHAATLVSARLGRVRSLNVRMAIPSIAGEVTEQIAKCSLKRLNATPEIVDKGGVIVSYGTVAILGLVMGGPTGSASAIATHSWARAASRIKIG